MNNWKMADPDRMLTLYRQLDQAWEEATIGYAQSTGRSITCRAGCFDCCFTGGGSNAFTDTVALAFSPSEAVILHKALKELPSQTLQEVGKSAIKYQTRNRPKILNIEQIRIEIKHTYKQCPLLTAEGRCCVYHARPLACRTYGLPVGYGNGNLACPKNYWATDWVIEPEWMRQWKQTLAVTKSVLSAERHTSGSLLQIISLALVIEAAFSS